MKRIAAWLLAALLFLPAVTALAAPADDLQEADANVAKAIARAEQGDFTGAEDAYKAFSTSWFDIEDGVKKKSKTAYGAIEDAMGDVRIGLDQKPANQAAVLTALRKLQRINADFIAGKTAVQGTADSSAKTVADLVALLDRAVASLQASKPDDAKAAVAEFRHSWLDIEGIVISQSQKVYNDTERDMVSASGMLASTPPNTAGAEQTLRSMRDYLSPLAGKTSYSMLDAVTILLREGLEALLVVVALLGFLKKAGHEDKRAWVWSGVGGGIAVSLVLGVLIQLLFSSGAFGSNNFLIAGYTGMFAAVMLLYMSYWLHSKSSLGAWQQYIQSQSTRALATGSLWSLAILSFLAVFREGTETVLFFIGMASSIGLVSLLAGIAIGTAILLVLSYLVLKVGVRIPMRPFFLVSSVLVFYLCFKFLGMGVHGLQMAGALRATHSTALPSIDWLAFYPTWENAVPQGALLLCAAIIILWNRRKDLKLRRSLKMQEQVQ